MSVITLVTSLLKVPSCIFSATDKILSSLPSIIVPIEVIWYFKSPSCCKTLTARATYLLTEGVFVPKGIILISAIAILPLTSLY